MAFFGSSWNDDDDMSLNEVRVKRYLENHPIFLTEDLTKVRRVVEYYIKGSHSKLSKTDLNKLVDKQLVLLKKKGII